MDEGCSRGRCAGRLWICLSGILRLVSSTPPTQSGNLDKCDWGNHVWFGYYKLNVIKFHFLARVQREGEAQSANFLAVIYRVTETAAKELILAKVNVKADEDEDKLSSPECLKLMAVKEILVRRWVPTQERH